MRRLFVILLCLLPTSVLAQSGPPKPAPPPEPTTTSLAALRIFPQTGHSLSGPLGEFWAANGGLAVFGVPTTSARPFVSAASAQITERARLEYHPENPAPYTVQLGLIGKLVLENLGRDWRSEGAGEPMDGSCRSFPATGRSVCGPFLRYWQGHGLNFGQPGISDDESLALFGLPLTAPQFERNSSGDRVLTQWFERARFELHPNNPPEHQVLLGRLGAELAGEAPAPARMTLSVPATIVQGRTWSFTLADNGFASVVGTAGDWPLTFARQPDGRWLGLGGANVLQALGPLGIQVSAVKTDGSAVYGEASIGVVDGKYPAERVVLPPEVNDSIANNQAKVDAERAMVNAIWPIVTPQKLWRGRFILPANGRMVSEFGTRRAYNDGPYSSYHEGLDIANVTGTPVVATGRGRVVLAQDDLIVRGGAVILDHGLGIHTGYWHLDKVLAKEGAIVEQGDVIGLMGTKGFSTAPHVHWDLRIGGLNVSPLEWTTQDWGKSIEP
ncbi:MAG: M23 family metallopeptidase [Herpetosiphonaceae bacterium]|nr:M23 family metallopeptidase [Herpetosiphonaceae bacterium]